MDTIVYFCASVINSKYHMSHEEHQGTHHTSENNKSKTAFKSSFWFVVILVGLFIAALNFISAESGDTEEGAKTEKTEMATPGTETASPATNVSDNGHTEVPAANTTDSSKH
jgi:hypothetical protein